MSNFVSVDMSELDLVATELTTAGPRVANLADAVTREVRDRTGDEAQAAAPVRTGELAGSREDFDEGVEHGTRFTAGHAIYVEFGTSTMAPQPFMWPAASRAEKSLESGVEKISDPFV